MNLDDFANLTVFVSNYIIMLSNNDEGFLFYDLTGLTTKLGGGCNEIGVG